MTPVRLEPAASRSRVKHSTTALSPYFVYSTWWIKGELSCKLWPLHLLDFCFRGIFRGRILLRKIVPFISVLSSVRQSVLLVTRIPPFLTEVVHILHNDCLWFVDNKKANQITNMTMGSKERSLIGLLNSVLRLVTRTPLWLRVFIFSTIIAYDVYITKKFSKYGSKGRVQTYLKSVKICLVACNANSYFIID